MAGEGWTIFIIGVAIGIGSVHACVKKGTPLVSVRVVLPITSVAHYIPALTSITVITCCGSTARVGNTFAVVPHVRGRVAKAIDMHASSTWREHTDRSGVGTSIVVARI